MDLLKSGIPKILELMNFPLYHPGLVLVLLCFDELVNKVIINLQMHWQRNTELAGLGVGAKMADAFFRRRLQMVILQ